MKDLIKSADLLMMLELERALEKHGEAHSPHEGYALILEEVDEYKIDAKQLDSYLYDLWESIKMDDNKYAKECAKSVKQFAKAIVAEAVQVGAMAEKPIRYYEREEK